MSFFNGYPHIYPCGAPFSGSAEALMKYHSPGKTLQSLFVGRAPGLGWWGLSSGKTDNTDVALLSKLLFLARRLDDRRLDSMGLEGAQGKGENRLGGGRGRGGVRILLCFEITVLFFHGCDRLTTLALLELPSDQ
jgi:hypothetical protein